MKQISTLIVLLCGLISSSCSHTEKPSPKDFKQTTSLGMNIEDVIKGYFDKNDWHYRKYIDEDSVITYVLRFNGNYEKLLFHVNIIPQDDIYEIICQSKTVLAQKDIDKGIIAINKYNYKTQVVSGCISPEGNIIFWLGRNIDGNTFSEQVFAVDLDMVFKEADDETAQIYKQALSNS